MLSGVAVLEDDVEPLEVVDNEARGAVRGRDGRIAAHADLGHDRGHEGRVVGDQVEHGVVRAVLHGVEGDLELDRAVRGEKLLNLERDEREVVDVVILVDRPKVGERRGGVVGDGGSDICEMYALVIVTF